LTDLEHQQVQPEAKTGEPLRSHAAATARDVGADRVKLGLVEQQSAVGARFIDTAQGLDAIMARHDERLKPLEQFVRDLAVRRIAQP